MRNDWICWIDSRTIKKGRVLVLDGSLVPLCSKCLDACMRSNDVLKKIEKGTKLCADYLNADSPLLVRGRSATHFENVPERLLVSGGIDFYRADGPAQVVGRSAPLTQNYTRDVASLVGLMV